MDKILKYEDGLQLNHLHLGDCKLWMDKIPDKYINILYTDPPYNMGSLYYIDSNGHYRFLKASDFMSKWDVWDGLDWDIWFKKAVRIMKDGAFMILHNIDRQADLWTYYGRRNGLIPLQKLYWLFASNFPKGVDVSLAIDTRLGHKDKRQVIGQRETSAQKTSVTAYGDWSGDTNLTAGYSEQAQKYEGYKYGVAPLKQMLEEILVLWKPPAKYMQGISLIDTILGYEANQHSMNFKDSRNPIHPPVFNIRKTMVAPTNNLKSLKERYTPQLIVHDVVAPFIKSSSSGLDMKLISEMLPRVGYTDDEMMPYYYAPKASVNEREDGLEELEYKTVGDGRKSVIDNPFQSNVRLRKNLHPSPKPVQLCRWVLNLFNLPDKIIVLDTFAGQCSIPKACQDLGIDFIAFELNEEYANIGYLKLTNTQKTLFGG